MPEGLGNKKGERGKAGGGEGREREGMESKRRKSTQPLGECRGAALLPFAPPAGTEWATNALPGPAAAQKGDRRAPRGQGHSTPLPLLPLPREAAAPRDPKGPNPGFWVLAPAHGVGRLGGGGDDDFAACAVLLLSVCVRVDGHKRREKRNFRVTTKGFLVQLF